MALSDEQIKQDQAAYAAAFDEDMAPAAEPSEDEAFGIAPPDGEQGAEPPAGEQEAAPPVSEAEAVDQVAATADEQTQAEGAGDGADAPDGEPRAEGEDGEDLATDASDGQAAPAANADIEKERQRLKSWEGRLKKMQAELEAKNADKAANAEPSSDTPVADAIEEVAAETPNSELAEAAEQVAEQVQNGELTPEQAMKQLSEDFGEDFVRMIEVIAKAGASKAAAEKVGELDKAVNEIIADITDTKARTHFETIAAKHPDFNDIGQSAEFKSYIGSLPEADKADAERVVSSGSAKEIIALLDGFKSSQQNDDDPTPTPDPVVDAQMDAAEGVRSSGMALPDQPKPASDSYEDAWKEFA